MHSVATKRAPGVLAFALLTVANAELVDCPFDGADIACEVTDAANELLIVVDPFIDEVTEFSWIVGGIEHLPVQDFSLYDRVIGAPTEDVLVSARQDEDANLIEIVFRDAGAFEARGLFTLTTLADGAQIEGQITITSETFFPVAGRLYGYTNFDLNGDAVDEWVIGRDGNRFIQKDGDTLGIVEFTAGDLPGAYQAGFVDALSSVLFAPFVTVDLDNTVVNGAGDIEHAFSWDGEFDAVGEQLLIVLRNSIRTDNDGDGIANGSDNCLFVANGPAAPDAGGNSQRDSDGDNIGNVCDGDIAVPNDCRINFLDLNTMKSAFFSNPTLPTWNPDADLNGDDGVNFLDLLLLQVSFFGIAGPSGLTNGCIGVS